jgi:hypothetical protein
MPKQKGFDSGEGVQFDVAIYVQDQWFITSLAP